MPLTSATNIELYGMMGDGHDSFIPVTVAIKVPVAAIKVFVYKIQVNPIHTILKYGIYYFYYYLFMDR